MSPERTLNDVCESVADGSAIDWKALDTEARDQDARDLLAQLQVVSELASAHRLIEEPISADRTRECTTGSVVPIVELHRWGRYDLVEQLGRGTFGRVYRAWDPDLERFIAIKLIHPIEGVKDVVRERVLDEGRAIAKINHPNVVSIHGVEVHDGQVGLCMELVKGKTLDEIVRTQGTLGAQEAAMIGQSVCRALSAVHAANLVHRDVKARNVMRADGGRIVLMDFGAGQVMRDSARARAAGMQGTPIYMAPEALAGAPGSIATDIYSTGVLLYFLVSGRYPFEGTTTEEVERAHMRGERRFVADHRPDLPAAFVSAVEKALDPNPRRRQESASKLMYELMETAELIQPEPGPSPFRQLAVFLAKNSGVRAASVALSVAVALTVLGFFTSFAYGFTFGLDSTYLNEGPFQWFVWGVKSMVAPLTIATVVTVVFLLLNEVVALVRRVSQPVDDLMKGIREAAARSVRRTGFTPSSALACLLLAFAVLFDSWIMFRRFPDLIEAMVWSINDASPEMLFRLSLGNYDEQTAFRQVLALGVLVMAFGLFKAVQIARRRGERLRSILVGGVVAATVFNIVLMDFPYRILWWNEGTPVLYQGSRCYRLASKDDSVQLFCPDRTPRRIGARWSEFTDLTGDHSALESIFEPFSRRISQ